MKLSENINPFPSIIDNPAYTLLEEIIAQDFAIPSLTITPTHQNMRVQIIYQYSHTVNSTQIYCLLDPSI